MATIKEEDVELFKKLLDDPNIYRLRERIIETLRYCIAIDKKTCLMIAQFFRPLDTGKDVVEFFQTQSYFYSDYVRLRETKSFSSFHSLNDSLLIFLIGCWPQHKQRIKTQMSKSFDERLGLFKKRYQHFLRNNKDEVAKRLIFF